MYRLHTSNEVRLIQQLVAYYRQKMIDRCGKWFVCVNKHPKQDVTHIANLQAFVRSPVGHKLILPTRPPHRQRRSPTSRLRSSATAARELRVFFAITVFFSYSGLCIFCEAFLPLLEGLFQHHCPKKWQTPVCLIRRVYAYVLNV